MLEGTALEADFPLEKLAMRTEGSSGSDLKEICRNAAMVPVREYMKSAGGDRKVLEKGRDEGFQLRPLRFDDFFAQDAASTPIPGLGARRFEEFDPGVGLD